LEDGTVTAASVDKLPSKQPAWSSDGKYLAFIITRYSSEIWIRNNQDGVSYQYTHSKTNNNGWPVWSPYDDMIIFTQSPLDHFLPWLTYVAFPDANEPIEYKIPQENHPVPSPAMDADISTDGKWLVFEAWPESGNHDIYLMTTSGENVIRLTVDIHLDFQPAWRP
jgi:Tol biopolymer transport system component